MTARVDSYPLLGLKTRSRTNLELLDRVPASDAVSAAFAPPSKLAKAARIASGEQQAHVVTSVSYGVGRGVTCSCGFETAGRDDEAMAKSFALHAYRFDVERKRS